MRVLFDTNVVLDVLLKRQPWVTEAQALWQANDDGRLTGFLAANTLTDIFYVARKLAGIETARQATQICLEAFEICPIDRSTLELAAQLPGTDLEDNIQIAYAHQSALDIIITRDTTGFQNSTVPAQTPAEVVMRLKP